ncbi:hypothetical protein [Silvibacterium sp.]|uniref:hypothetical protein n=1 Tax=Silvibacterium sp. TaxID=1964179 RepID=UPI0039E53BD5
MRRSSIWFLIAFLWLIDAGISLHSGGLRRAALPGAILGIFLLVGLVHRKREEAAQAIARRRPRISGQTK